MNNVVYNEDCMLGMKRYPNDYFDLAIVDPVYSDVTRGGYMAAHGGGGANPVHYDNSIWGQEKTPPEYFDELFRVSKNQIIWGGNYFMEAIHRDSQCWLVWDKKRAEGVSFADCELAWTSFNKAVRIFRFRWDGFFQEDMKNKEKRIHPTQKPVALYEWILENYAKQGDKILDTHVGSGSSRIACHHMGYDFTGYEINKTYFDLQEKRFLSETAQMNLFRDI